MAQVIWRNDQGKNRDISSIFSRMVDASDLPERLRRAGRTQADLARHLNLDPSSLTKTIKGQRRLKADEMLAVENFFRDAREEGKAPSDNSPRFRGLTRKFPLYGYPAAGGEDRVGVSDTDIVDWIDPPPFWNGVGELFGVRVVGLSMEPRLFEGEMVVAQHSLPPSRDRDCVVEFTDGTSVVKTYVTQRDGFVYCKQWSPAQDLRYKTGDVKALHAVIWRR